MFSIKIDTAGGHLVTIVYGSLVDELRGALLLHVASVRSLCNEDAALSIEVKSYFPANSVCSPPSAPVILCSE